MSNRLHNTVRTINRLCKEADKYTKSNPERACSLLEKAHALAKDCPFPTRALVVAKARVLRVLANCSFIGNQLDTALLHASQAAELFHQAGEVDEYIKTVVLMQTVQYHKGEPAVALELLQSCLQLENKTTNRSLLGQVQGNMAVLFSTLGDSQKAIHYFQQALHIAEECKNQQGICQALSNIAINHTSAGNLLPALECLLKALSAAEKLTADKERTTGNVLMRIGNTLRLLGNYDQALEYMMRSLSLLEEHGSLMEVGVAFQYIGLIYHDKEEYSLAKTYVTRALAINDGKDGAQQVRISSKIILAQIELLLGNVEQAQNHILETLNIGELPNSIKQENTALGILAEIAQQQQNYAAARAYYQQILDTYGSEEGIYTKISTLVGLGKVLVDQQHYREALEHLHTALALAEQTNIKPLLFSVYEVLAEAYECSGDTKHALKYFKLFHEMDKQLFNEKAEQNMQVLKILHHVEQIEKENALQEQDNKQLQQTIEQVQNALTVHVLHLAQQTDLLQKTKSELSAVITQQLPMVQQSLDSAIETLSRVCPHTQTRKASAKNTFLQMTNILSSVEKETLGTVQESLKSLVYKLDAALLDQGMWQAFEQQFQQINSGFMETLVRRYPQLSTTEIKVCSLIKINLSSKEIGHILNVSLRSVETYRYNIRKKLGLVAQDNLSQFIAELA